MASTMPLAERVFNDEDAAVEEYGHAHSTSHEAVSTVSVDHGEDTSHGKEQSTTHANGPVGNHTPEERNHLVSEAPSIPKVETLKVESSMATETSSDELQSPATDPQPGPTRDEPERSPTPKAEGDADLATPVPLDRRFDEDRFSIDVSDYIMSIERRIKHVEASVKQILDPGASEANPKKIFYKRPDDEDLIVSIRKLTWPDFHRASHDPVSDDCSTIDLLAEEPYSGIALFGPRGSFVQGNDSRRQSQRIERIRFNSMRLTDVFYDFLGPQYAPLLNAHQLRPFKMINAFSDEILAKIIELERQISEFPATEDAGLQGSTTTAKEVDPKAASNECGVADDQPDHRPLQDEGSQTSGASEETEKLAPKESLLLTLDHLRGLYQCLKSELADEFASHQRLRARTASTTKDDNSSVVKFAELWHLFAPGDLIYVPKISQALIVLAVRGGRPHLIDENAPAPYKPYNPYGVADSNANQIARRLKPTEDISDFVITCFYLGLNGGIVGPVQVQKSIEPFEGSREIKSLDVMPIEFADARVLRLRQEEARNCKGLKDFLIARGRVFAELIRSEEAGKPRRSCFPGID